MKQSCQYHLNKKADNARSFLASELFAAVVVERLSAWLHLCTWDRIVFRMHPNLADSLKSSVVSAANDAN
jgi:hypothetical protein